MFKPKCLNGKEGFIDAEGFYKPCCWRPTKDYFNKDEFNIALVDITDAIKSADKFIELQQKQDPQDLDFTCYHHCYLDNNTERDVYEA